jgi:hypothetical protein
VILAVRVRGIVVVRVRGIVVVLVLAVVTAGGPDWLRGR